MKKKTANKGKKKFARVFSRAKVPQDVQNIIACAAVEKAESHLVEKEIQGEVIDKWVYSFIDRDGVERNGLTYWGYVACAEGQKPQFRWTPKFAKPELTVVSPSAVSLLVACTNPRTRKTEYGICSYNPTTKFEDRQALTKAKRYAMDKLTRPPLRISFVNYVLSYEPSKVLLVTEGEVVEAKQEILPEETDKMKQLRYIFTKIANLQLPRDRMHAHLRKHYKTKHLKDLDVAKLEEIKKGLDYYKKDKSRLADIKNVLKEMSPADLKEWGDQKEGV